MPQSPPQTPYQKFRDQMEGFIRGTADPARPRLDPVSEALRARAAQAVPAGLAAIDGDPTRWLPTGSLPLHWSADAFVTHTLEDRLVVQDDAAVRWLLLSYCLLLADLDGICRHLGELSVRDLDDVPWLVAGALWVEWSSGQPGTDALRDTLRSVGVRRADLAAHIQQALTAQGTSLELWRIAERVIADPAFRIPHRPATP
jgi:hypothetical protein